MKVLYISKALVVAEYRTKLVAMRDAADVVAVIPRRWGSQPVEAVNGIPVAIRQAPVLFHGRNHFHVYPSLATILRDERPDIVHIDEEPYSLVTLQAVRLARRSGIPVLFFGWQNLAKRLPPPFERLRSTVYRLADGAITGTPAAARVLRDGGYEGPLAVIPQFGVDVDRFRPDPAARDTARTALGAGPSDFVVGFGGRLVPEKGVQLLLQAVASMAADTRLVVAGTGPEEPALRALAISLGIAERVHFSGSIPSTSMPGWLAGLDTLALPSLTTPTWAEQFGRILVEAMACGVPVVGSRSGEIPHVVGDAGLLFPEGDVEALRDALAALAADPALRARLSLAGRERAVDRFSQKRVASETVAFYTSLLARRRG